MDDADEAIIRRRMEVYDSQTIPVIGYYPREIHWRVLAAGAECGPLAVLQDVAKLIERAGDGGML